MQIGAEDTYVYRSGTQSWNNVRITFSSGSIYASGSAAMYGITSRWILTDTEFVFGSGAGGVLIGALMNVVHDRLPNTTTHNTLFLPTTSISIYRMLCHGR